MFRLSYLYVIRGCLYDRVLADVRSTGAGIECLYCNSSWPEVQGVLPEFQ